MNAPDILFGLLGVGAVAAATVPAVRSRLRWRRVLRPRVGAAPRRPGQELLDVARSVVRSGRRTPVLIAAGALAAGTGLALDGPVAGAVLAAYAVAAIVVVRRRARGRAENRSRVASVDAVATLAAELRAGLAVPAALQTATRSLSGTGVVGPAAEVVAARLSAAVQLAEDSGAPLADVLDRLDAHLRAAERARATADAQAAGALASGALLAVMPVAGVALGGLVGINPERVLLHTPIGAACLCGAVLLQIAGLAWSARLSRVEVLA